MRLTMGKRRRADWLAEDRKFCSVAAATIGSAVVGGLMSSGGSKQSGTSTSTQQTQLDPRIQSMLFGDGSNPGLLSQYQDLLNQPQNGGAATYGHAADNYIGTFGASDLEAQRAAAMKLMAGNTPAPQVGAEGASALWNTGETANAATVNAPSQNGLDLTGSYNHFINGDAGANPYLTKATQGAIDQSTNQFRQMQSEATDNLMRNIMPSIRSNSVLAGQYGGSRQGIAEGNAISDFTKQQEQAATQFGQNNTNQAVGAQAQSFNQGQDRALAATQGLGAQQYGVASQNASMQQAANAQTSAQNQQANLANQSMNTSLQQFNAGQKQQASLANQSAQLNTNSLNSANTLAGMGGLSGILGGAAGQAQNQDNYGVNRAQQVNGLLAPYMSANGSTSTQQPYYTNPAGNVIGGATAGLGLYNQYNKLLGGSSGGVPSYSSYASNDWLTS